MKTWKSLIPFYDRYVAAMSRVSALEMAFSILLESPRYLAGETIGFNAQRHRKRIFLELCEAIGFDTIVETGTFVGNTTGYMAEMTGAKVHTCEANGIFSALARSRLSGFSNISFEIDDSRAFLRKFTAARPVVPSAAKPVFYYLDAHWQEDLPLEREIAIIARDTRDFVLMIDDFAVPGDAGYGYDDYGKNQALNLATFGATFTRWDLVPFFPSLPAAEETGGKRGCVVLARRGPTSERIGKLKSLRHGSSPAR